MIAWVEFEERRAAAEADEWCKIVDGVFGENAPPGSFPSIRVAQARSVLDKVTIW